MNGENQEQEKINIDLEKLKKAEEKISKSQEEEKTSYQTSELEVRKKRKGWKRFLIFLILISIIVGAFYLWKNKTNHKDAPSNEMTNLIKQANEQLNEILKKRGPITSKDIEEANRLLDLVSKKQ